MPPEVTRWIWRARQTNLLLICQTPGFLVPLTVSALAWNSTRTSIAPHLLWALALLSAASVGFVFVAVRRLSLGMAARDGYAPDDPRQMTTDAWSSVWWQVGMWVFCQSSMILLVAAPVVQEQRTALGWRLACVAAWVAGGCVAGLYALAAFRLAGCADQGHAD